MVNFSSKKIKGLIAAVLFFLLSGCTSFQSQSPGFAYSGEPVDRPVRKAKSGGLEFSWPVKKIKINRGFKPPYRGKKHFGLDLGGGLNTPILSSHPGVVIYAGQGYRGYGKVVIVEYDDSWATLYAHLNRIKVRAGEILGRGQVLGLMGRTGRSTGVHLHFEIIYKKAPIDPLKLLKDPEQGLD